AAQRHGRRCLRARRLRELPDGRPRSLPGAAPHAAPLRDRRVGCHPTRLQPPLAGPFCPIMRASLTLAAVRCFVWGGYGTRRRLDMTGVWAVLFTLALFACIVVMYIGIERTRRDAYVAVYGDATPDLAAAATSL